MSTEIFVTIRVKVREVYRNAVDAVNVHNSSNITTAYKQKRLLL
jgi:hypothetical protein